MKKEKDDDSDNIDDGENNTVINWYPKYKYLNPLYAKFKYLYPLYAKFKYLNPLYAKFKSLKVSVM